MRIYADLPPTWAAPVEGVVCVRRDHVQAGEALLLEVEEPGLEAVMARHLRAGIECWVAVGNVPDLRRAASAGAKLWLRGLEAGGACGEVGALVLIREARKTGRPFVVQGLGIRGMAASLCVGAHGVVLDAMLWATDESPLHPDHKTRLRGRSGRDTRVIEGRRSTHGTVSPTWVSDPNSALPASCCYGQAPAGKLALVLSDIRSQIEARMAGARENALRSDPFGTGKPLVQGPMANVSEKAGLARAVLAAGGIPFCALGALRPDAANAVLVGMKELPGPWGAGVIGFDVMPHRDAHIEAIGSHGPRRITLAGGSPALAERLTEEGHEPWLHTPSARLAQIALGRGVPTVIFEGCEAGGHVGALPSSSLWEEGLAVLEARDRPATVVLAGGIGDAVSAAFAAAMSSRAHQLGHRVAFQIGTALFFTHEIVESEQITGGYQQAALSAQTTVTVGSTVNLPLQCAPNRFTREAIGQEFRWQQSDLPLEERRTRVEHHNLGRTRIAAKGIERDGHGGYQTVPTRRQIDEGAFTMGQGACSETRLMSVAALFDELTQGAAAILDARVLPGSAFGPVRTVPGAPTPLASPSRARPAATAAREIAVVGVGCVLPGAANPAEFWRLLMGAETAIRAVPDDRWKSSRYFDPDDSVSRSYTRMAGHVIGFDFDPLAFNIPPRVVPSMDRAQQMALVAAAQAIGGVRIRDRRRTAVALGNSMGGEHAKSLAVRIRFREVLAALDEEGALSELSDDQLGVLHARVERRLSEGLPPVDVDSMSGLLSNVIAGRVASWLDLMGGNTTIDAACASSLAAISLAADWLRSGTADLVLTGGVDADLSPETFVGFCRTHALSRSGALPFSSNADGFVMGEGAAVFALKRLEDARSDNDTIWAVIRGIGQSSDGRSTGITAPKVEGQRLAIQRAFTDCEIDPTSVEMIEAHGTGTALGDKTEITALASVFSRPGTALGSVKSQIGHLKGAAGAAGLLKAVLSVRYGLIPPTLVQTPTTDTLHGTPFSLPRSPTPFAEDGPRRACVSAFGFGGTNYHLVLEATPAPEPAAVLATSASAWGDESIPSIRSFGADDRALLATQIASGHNRTAEEVVRCTVRAVVLDGDLDAIAGWVAGGGTGAFGRSAWCAEGPPEDPVWLFPGQGSPRIGAISLLHQVSSGAAALADVGVSAPSEAADPAAQHHLLVACAIGWTAVLKEVPCAGVIGHSVGELGAMVAAGRLGPREALDLAAARGAALASCAPGRMVAMAEGAPAEQLARQHGLRVAVRNSAKSTVLAGPQAAVEAALEAANQVGIRATMLDVERAFHTPDVAPAADAVRSALTTCDLRPGRPWWSNVGRDDGDGDALVEAITAPVDFVGCIERAGRAGHKLFLHAGPGAVLSRHVEATLPGARVIALQPDPATGSVDLVRAAAALLAEGHLGLLGSLPGSLVHQPFPLAPAAPEPRHTGGLVLDIAIPATLPIASIVRSEFVPEGVRGAVITAIGEVTGYPPEALTPGARLDTDLGVDSIRKMEIVGLLQERLGLEIDDAELSQLGALDLDGLVDWMEQQTQQGHTTPVAPVQGTDAIQMWTRTWVRAGAAGVAAIPSSRDLPDLIGPWLDDRESTPIRLSLDPDVPAHHGLAAFLRVLASEQSREVDLQFVRDGSQWIEAWARPMDPIDHPEDPVVFATGGTTGIVAACIAAIPGARGVLVGRRQDMTPPPGFDYIRCDLEDPVAVASAVRACRDAFGGIDIVVHGAGLLRDGPIQSRTAVHLAEVSAPKLAGGQALMEATREDSPLFVPFSSVSSTLANPGQSLYAAVNATLERMEHPTGRTVPLLWTAWTERGMAKDPALQRLLRARGIVAIDPAEGTQAFLEAIRHRGPVWLAKEDPAGARLPWPLTHIGAAGQLGVTLDPADPLLSDHAVGGIPLVPAALWLSAFTQAAAITLKAGAVEVTDLEILAPTFVRSATRAEVRIEGDKAWVSREGTVVCTARVQAAQKTSQAPVALVAGSAAAALYREDLLFHGPAWQMLVTADVEGPSARAEIRLNGTDALATAIDGAHQLLAAWSGRTTGFLGLPVGADSWTLTQGTFEGPVHLALTAEVDENGVIGNVLGVDSAGLVVVRGTGVRMQNAGRWVDA